MSAYRGQQMRRGSGQNGREKITWLHNWQGSQARDFTGSPDADKCPWSGHDPLELGQYIANLAAAGIPNGYRTPHPLIGLNSWHTPIVNAYGNVYTQSVGLNATGEFYLGVAWFNLRTDGIRELHGSDTNNFVRFSQVTGEVFLTIAGDPVFAWPVHGTKVGAGAPKGPLYLELWRDASNVIHVWANGVDIGLGVTKSGTFDVSGFGANNAGTGQHDDPLAEFLFCDGLPSEAERAQLREHMRRKWRLYERTFATAAAYETEQLGTWWHTPATHVDHLSAAATGLAEPSADVPGMARFALALESYRRTFDAPNATVDGWLARATRWLTFHGFSSNLIGGLFWPSARVALLDRYALAGEMEYDGNPGGVQGSLGGSGLWSAALGLTDGTPTATAVWLALRHQSTDPTTVAVAAYLLDVLLPALAERSPNIYGWGDFMPEGGGPVDSWLGIGAALEGIVSTDRHASAGFGGTGSFSATPRQTHIGTMSHAGRTTFGSGQPIVISGQTIHYGRMAHAGRTALVAAGAKIHAGSMIHAGRLTLHATPTGFCRMDHRGRTTWTTNPIHRHVGQAAFAGRNKIEALATIFVPKKTFAAAAHEGATIFSASPAVRGPIFAEASFEGSSRMQARGVHEFMPNPTADYARSRAERARDHAWRVVKRDGQPVIYYPAGDLASGIKTIAIVDYSGTYYDGAGHFLLEGVTVFLARHEESIKQARVNDLIQVEMKPGQVAELARVKRIVSEDEGMFVLEVVN